MNYELDIYDFIINIDSLENLQKNGWNIEWSEKGYEKYHNSIDKRNKIISFLGNKKSGKSFILFKIIKYDFPNNYNLTTRGLSVLYPKNEENNIICLDTFGLDHFNINIDKSKKEEENIEQINKLLRDRFLTIDLLKNFLFIIVI